MWLSDLQSRRPSRIGPHHSRLTQLDVVDDIIERLLRHAAPAEVSEK